MTDSQRKHGWYLDTRGYQILTGLIALIAASVLLWVTPHSTSALTTVPTKMHFQGRLTDSSGNIMPNGTYNMRLKLYTVSTAGSAVWSEDRLVSATQGVPVTNGLFSIKLGDITTLPASLFAGGELYLEVELPSPATATSASPTWSEGPMTPRNQMATSAYAYNAETLDGLDSAAFGQLTQNNTWSGNNTFSGSVLAQGSLTLGTTAAQGSLVVHDGNGQTATIVVADTAGNYTYTLPVTTANDTFCLQTLANCGGGSGVTTVGALDGGTANANGATISGTTIYLQSASGTYSGLVNTTAQNFAGVKTFNSGAVIAAGQSLTVTGGTTGTRPASPTEGMVYYDTSTKQLLTYANGKWQQDRTDAVLVAASNSSQSDKDAADYVADGNTGAAADGDQVQINQALTAGAGKKVVLLAGTYVADASISVPNKTQITGVGASTLIEFANLSGATDFLIENTDQTTGEGIVIQDLKLDGRKDLNASGTQHGMYFTNSGGGTGSTARDGVKVSRVVATNFRSSGIVLTTTAHNSIVADSTFSNNGNSGLYVYSKRNVIKNNTARNNTTAGYFVTTGSSENNFSGNIADSNTGVGMNVNSSNNNTITSNVFTANNNGLTLVSSSNNTVTGNTASSNVTDGIGVHTSANNNTVSNNTSSGNGGDGIYVMTSNNNTVNGNNVQGTSTYGINIWDADYTQISNNTVKDSSYAIYLDLANNSTVTGNNLSGAAGDVSLLLESSTDNTVTSNYTDGGSRGIQLQTSSTGNNVSNNTVENTTLYGIRLVDNSHNNVISGNRIIESGGSTTNNGIYLDASDSNSITDNSITDTSATTNNYAINVFNSTSDTNYLADNTLGSGSINDLGTGTIYGGQINASGQLVSSSSGGTVSKLQPSSGSDLYQGQNSTGTALFKVTSTGAIQGTSLDTIGATALALGGTSATAININQDTTVLAGKTLTVGTSSNGIILSDTGLTLAGAARGTKTVTLVPEYQGATFRGDGTNNTGSLSSDLCSATTGGLGINTAVCATSNEEHNYYEWANTEATAQDYDIYVRYKLPADYSTGSMTNLKFFAQGTTTGEAATLVMYSGSTQCSSTGDVVTVATTWTEGTVASPLGTCTPTANSYVTFKITLSATQNNQARAGEISLTYRSSF